MTPFRTRLALVSVALVLAVGGCTNGDEVSDGATSTIGSVLSEAPEFAGGLDWLNVPTALTLDRLKGKVVLVYFWTSSCVTCRDVIADVRRLEKEFPDEVVLVGVHSGKYDAERSPEFVQGSLVRLGVNHAVINDPDFSVWREWDVKAWPTTVLVDPAGTVVDVTTGDDVYDRLQPSIASVVDDFRDRGELVTATAVFLNDPAPLPRTVLAYPGAVLADVATDRLFISDTAHHRLVVADLTTGEVRAVVGSGEAGLADGPIADASFDRPQGLALSADGGELFVADTGNHLIRRIDLEAGIVSTVAGTGVKGEPPYAAGPAPETALSFPWDVVVDEGRLLVAMAGANQIWSIDLADGMAAPLVGSGRQGNNGTDLAQPAGLALSESGDLFVADSASSTIRRVDLDGGAIDRLAGGPDGLFDFGDDDGQADTARFQYPLGVAVDGNDVWVADTFNNAIRRVDGVTGEIATLAGGGSGWRDGADPLFSQPGGLSVNDGKVYVADIGNHSVRVVDIDSGETETIILKGIELLVPDGPDEEFVGVEIRLDPVTVAPGPGRVVLEVDVPAGFKINPFAPSRFEWTSSGGIAVLDPAANRSIVEPKFPLEVTATFASGEGEVVADLWIVYCEAETESICLFDRARLNVPVIVTGTGGSDVVIPYQIVLPELG